MFYWETRSQENERKRKDALIHQRWLAYMGLWDTMKFFYEGNEFNVFIKSTKHAIMRL